MTRSKFSVSQTRYRHRRKLSVENEQIAQWLLLVTAFSHDNLSDGLTFQLFNVLDDFKRERLGIEVDLSLPAARVIKSLEQIIYWRDRPNAQRSDNVTEYLSGVLPQ